MSNSTFFKCSTLRRSYVVTAFLHITAKIHANFPLFSLSLCQVKVNNPLTVLRLIKMEKVIHYCSGKYSSCERNYGWFLHCVTLIFEYIQIFEWWRGWMSQIRIFENCSFLILPKMIASSHRILKLTLALLSARLFLPSNAILMCCMHPSNNSVWIEFGWWPRATSSIRTSLSLSLTLLLVELFCSPRPFIRARATRHPCRGTSSTRESL